MIALCIYTFNCSSGRHLSISFKKPSIWLFSSSWLLNFISHHIQEFVRSDQSVCVCIFSDQDVCILTDRCVWVYLDWSVCISLLIRVGILTDQCVYLDWSVCVSWLINRCILTDQCVYILTDQGMCILTDHQGSKSVGTWYTYLAEIGNYYGLKSSE